MNPHAHPRKAPRRVVYQPIVPLGLLVLYGGRLDLLFGWMGVGTRSYLDRFRVGGGWELVPVVARTMRWMVVCMYAG